MEKIYVHKYSRQEAINEHVLVDIKAPIFIDDLLKKFLGHNDSICMTGNLLSDLIGMEDDKNSIDSLIRQIARDFVWAVQKERSRDIHLGGVLKFKSTVINEKQSFVVNLKSVTHIEDDFSGKDFAKCITFMSEQED